MKLLIGGSPCTHWSIAQTKNRETEASGIGWELFLNYRIARDKYKPDYFLYENNKSMSPAIRTQITAELGVEPVLINSALVSAHWPEEGALVALSYETGLGGSSYLVARCAGGADDEYPFISTDAGTTVDDILACQCDRWTPLAECERGKADKV